MESLAFEESRDDCFEAEGVNVLSSIVDVEGLALEDSHGGLSKREERCVNQCQLIGVCEALEMRSFLRALWWYS